jgi:hypothetical protein
MTDVQVSEADRVNRLVVQITEAAILALDADEDDTVRLAAFERGIVGYIEAALQSTAQLQAEVERLREGFKVGDALALIRLSNDLHQVGEADKVRPGQLGFLNKREMAHRAMCAANELAAIAKRFRDTLTTNSGGE